MPEKTIREMNKFQRMRHSLEARTFRATIMLCAILGLVLLMIGMALYTISLARQYISHAFYLSRYAALSATHEADTAGFAGRVMDIYRGLSEEERQEIGTEAYNAHFAGLLEDGEYRKLVDILPTFTNSENISAVYIAMYDEENSAMVYIADPDEEEPLLPGEWEPVNRKGMERFLNWDGSRMLYDIGRTEKYGWLCTAGTPIRGDGGEPVCFMLVDITINNVLRGVRAYGIQITVAMVVVMALLSWMIHRQMKSSVVQPINDIAEAAQKYIADRIYGRRETGHFSALNIHTGDEIENLSLIMEDMEREIHDYEANVTSITAEKERISTELGLATRIQTSMLPNIFPPFPERKEFDLYAAMDPAREVGGDFYDFFLIDDDHLCLMVADVSGKGIPAALFMMASRIILANNAMAGKSPAQILTDTNASICAHNRAEMFVTVWLGILEISTGKLTAANAGHEYPVLKKPDGGFALYRDKHGFVIGGMEGMNYKEYEMQLEPGTKLFLYTDGVTEAMDAEKKLFGTERMLETLNSEPDADVEETLKNVRRAVDAFAKDTEQFDDLTMLCLEYRGAGQKEEKTVNAQEMTIEALTDNLPQVLEFADGFLARAGFSAGEQMKIDLAIEEIFVNVANYAYAPASGDVKIRMEVPEASDTVEITFADSGVPYDPLSREDPDVLLSADERQVGGLGIFLTKKTMDEMSYEYRDGQNVLHMKKKKKSR